MTYRRFNFRELRRKFLSLPAPCCEVHKRYINDPRRKSRNEAQIVVVGAGLAGLSAASHLIKNGFTSTIVLEATERYGGRVKSEHFGDAYCELGAKYITIDSARNSIYELLSETHGLEKQTAKRDNIVYVNLLGQTINKRMPDLIDALFRKLCSGIELQEKFETNSLHDLNNVETYFQAESRKILENMFKGEEARIAGDIFITLFKEFGSLIGCCLDYLNIEHIRKVHNTNPNPLYIPQGLDNILRPLTDIITEHNIKMGKPVGQIKWYDASTTSTAKAHLVGCLDGSSFNADHIICTLPLGVLKNFSKYMFKPMLPRHKVNAIRNIGYGSPVKIYLEYNKNIKSWFTANLRPLWNEEERGSGLNWYKQIVEISKLPTSKHVLEVLIGGAFFGEIEKLPEDQITKEVTTILRICLKNPKVPYPKSILRSNWSNSACFLGGRPYFSVNSTINDVNILASPLGDRAALLFAGDATTLSGFGTVDGARQSGIREAERLIEFYNSTSA
ncbi:protein anon-37Cs isoform X2 [Teleopsis dalmanni]|uniref:protein anon-37Cs isoform X2 n=1 Tax=Teleopsis dalmanni TaxID=139649 RepID=UPI0018CF50E5|nr:protein anon-37Cs isoform X2 [Teleopsis dalmanni]